MAIKRVDVFKRENDPSCRSWEERVSSLGIIELKDLGPRLDFCMSFSNQKTYQHIDAENNLTFVPVDPQAYQTEILGFVTRAMIEDLNQKLSINEVFDTELFQCFREIWDVILEQERMTGSLVSTDTEKPWEQFFTIGTFTFAYLRHRAWIEYTLKKLLSQLQKDTQGDRTLGLQQTVRLIELGLANEQSMKDPMTQLPNRKALDLRLSDIEKEKPDDSFLVAMVDIDHFKRVNDTYGHIVGDEVIKGLARSLDDKTRSGDSFKLFGGSDRFKAFRKGGEEFLILIPVSSRDEGLARLEEIKADFQAKQFEASGKADFSKTVSIGYSVVFGRDVSEAMKHADLALYDAKQERDDIKEFDPNLDYQAIMGASIGRTPGVTSLREAVKRRLRQKMEENLGKDIIDQVAGSVQSFVQGLSRDDG